MNRILLLEQLPHLRRYARSLTGDSWSADDLVQDTLERACAKWSLWATGSNLRSWLLSLMHNLHQNHRRGQAPAGSHVNLEDVQHDLQAPARQTDEALDLARCLQRLPEDQRAVLLLVTLEDLSYAEVARVLQVPLGTVMSRLSRARTRLRELMEAPAHAVADNAPSQAAPAALRRLK